MILDTPIKKQSLQKMAYQSLRQAILEREIELGAVIKISKLAEKLNVSTMPVREALRQLEVESMVSFNSNKSIVASRLSRDELHDIYDLRIFSESEKAVTRANREHTLILDALRNGDRAKAKKVLRKHLRNGLWVIESHLETVV